MSVERLYVVSTCSFKTCSITPTPQLCHYLVLKLGSSPSRGVFTSAANKRDREVNRKRRGSIPSAFRVFRLSCKDLRPCRRWLCTLRFGRDRMGFERNHEGPSRTPRIGVKTLGVS